MNRLGIDNFMAPLTDSMELEFKDEYIIYRTTDDGIVDDFFEVRQYFVIMKNPQIVAGLW